MLELFIKKFISEKYPFRKATVIFNVELMEKKIFFLRAFQECNYPVNLEYLNEIN
jgi:hypothetical protein